MIKKYVFLQVRSNSKRLPNKCLYPILENPNIILLYKRIISKHYKIILLTSKDKTDDYLVNLLKKNNISFLRGNSENVYSRFIECSKNFDDDDIIVRLTADNLFLDENFLNVIFKKFINSNFLYGYVDRKRSRLPYGLGAEIFKLKILRKYKPKNNYDKEHVTPQIRRRFKKECGKFIIPLNINCFNKSSTLDTISDYYKIKYLFEKNTNYKISWKNLCKKLFTYKKNSSKFDEKLKNVVIGTAQFGMKYGISNLKKPSVNSIYKILDFCQKIGINKIDTANSYGNSEKIIANYLRNKKSKFQIYTKSNLSYKDLNPNSPLKEFKKNINNSEKLFGKSSIKGISIHNPKYYLQNKNFFDPKLKKLGINLGISLNEPNEFKKNLDNFLKFYQFPFNVLDRRWDYLIKKNRNKKIFIRSIYLQGLFFTEEKNVPKKFKNEFLKIKNELNKFVIKFNRFNLKDLLINFVKSYQGIDGIIIGINDLKQIKELPFYFYQKNITRNQRIQIIKSMNASNVLISPYKW